jgi:hypothetical protein
MLLRYCRYAQSKLQLEGSTLTEEKGFCYPDILSWGTTVLRYAPSDVLSFPFWRRRSGILDANANQHSRGPRWNILCEIEFGTHTTSRFSGMALDIISTTNQRNA